MNFAIVKLTCFIHLILKYYCLNFKKIAEENNIINYNTTVKNLLKLHG